jgi:hypothetical protein
MMGARAGAGAAHLVLGHGGPLLATVIYVTCCAVADPLAGAAPSPQHAMAFA